MNQFLAFILMVLAIADIGTTERILQRGGSELHPIVRWLMATFDEGWGAVKYGLTAYAAVQFLRADATLHLAASCLVMAAFVARNARIYKGMKP